MTGLDPQVLLAAAVTGLAVAVHLALTTSLRRPEPSALAWTSAYVAASGGAVLVSVVALGDGALPRWVLALVLAGGTWGVGALWVGVLHFDDRTWPATPAAASMALVAGAAALVLDAGLAVAVATACAAVLATLLAAALLRRPVGRNLDAEIGAASAVLFALASVVCSVSVVTGADVGAAFSWWVLLEVGGLVPLTALSLYGMQATRSASYVYDAQNATDEAALSVLDHATFAAVACDRVERAGADGGTGLSLVVATVADLEEVRVVYGSPVARLAVAHAADVVRAHVPVSSEVGHVGGGRFAVLSIDVPGRTAETVVEAVRTGLFAAEQPPQLDLRVACTFTTADSLADPDGFERLLGQVVQPAGRRRGPRPALSRT